MDVGPVFWALRDVVLEQSGELWRTTGFDMDGYCTRPPDFEAECVPPRITSSREIDGEGGIDNAFGRTFYPFVQLAVPDLEQVARDHQAAGRGAVLVHVSGWNGDADDPRVRVWVGVSSWGTSEGEKAPPEVRYDGMTPVLLDGREPMPPAWDGEDWLFARDDNFAGGDPRSPLLVDDNAYVANGALVVRLPDRTEIVFIGATNGVLVRITDGLLVGRLVDGRIEATLGGRWAVVDIAQSAQAVGVCPGSAQYDLLETQLDVIADVRSRPGTGGPGVRCDAISAWVLMTGQRARWGGIGPGFRPTGNCPGATARGASEGQ